MASPHSQLVESTRYPRVGYPGRCTSARPTEVIIQVKAVPRETDYYYDDEFQNHFNPQKGFHPRGAIAVRGTSPRNAASRLPYSEGYYLKPPALSYSTSELSQDQDHKYERKRSSRRRKTTQHRYRYRDMQSLDDDPMLELSDYEAAMENQYRYDRDAERQGGASELRLMVVPIAEAYLRNADETTCAHMLHNTAAYANNISARLVEIPEWLNTQPVGQYTAPLPTPPSPLSGSVSAWQLRNSWCKLDEQ